MQTLESFDHFHRKTLPARLAGAWGLIAARGTAGLPPLALRLPDGRAFSYVPGPNGVGIVPGDGPAKTVVELDEALWRGLIEAMETPMGILLFEKGKVVAGEGGDFFRWESGLRVLYEGLPPYDPTAPLIGRDGREIDPTRAFHPDDDPETMADFLRTTGFILVREVVPASEIAELLEAADALRARARPNDPLSWWGQHEDGRTLLTRVLDGGTHPRVRALLHDPRLLRIVALSDHALEATDTDVIHVLFKQSGMLPDGKTDNPWHRDCGLGLHATMCPVMNGSLFLRPSTPETGELRFMPGSWRTAGLSGIAEDRKLGVGIEAGPGDFALHYGDGLHAGPPPTAKDGPFRTSIVIEYGPVGRAPGVGQEQNDLQLFDVDTSGLR
ncbi:phytanoyl-CoA dioxygenase family protein [Myxococcota bacterium]|nr:phytanoyl-CoA dioxygenase family protein [Myxococcota bacterium]